MKRILFILVFVVCHVFGFAQGFIQHAGTEPYQTSFSQPQPGVYQVTFEILNAATDMVTINGVNYSVIKFGSTTVTDKKGWAELPFVSAAIQLPANKNVDMQVTPIATTSIDLDYPLLPSRGTIYRNQNPEEIPYEIDPASLTVTNYPADIAVMESPYIVRDVRGTSIRFYPFHYDATTHTLTLYTKVMVTLRENNETPTNPLLVSNTHPVKEAIGIYQNLFLNYEPTRDALANGEKGDILVITTAAYEDGIEPYIQWKKEMGYNVTKEVVANATNVTNMIQSAYNDNNNLMYVQLVGDWDNIKSNTITSEGSAAPADPKMGCVAGNDNFPDIAIGRFSCSSVAQLTVQVDKAINYEKNPNMEAGWRETFIGIGSAEGQGTGDDNEIDYTHVQRIFSERLDPFTYDTEKGNYGNNASASTLATHVNAGASTIAYCGHGAETYFVTTNYSNTNVNASTNGDKLPFIVAVACVNGKFHQTNGDCFAEAWLKKQNGGAVVTLMSTINQPWTPPQRGQDYFYDILVGGFDYNQYSDQSGINTNEQRTHWGSIVINAFDLALTESNTSSDLETFQTWTTFGDASLQLRTKQPDVLSLSNRTMMSNVPFTTVVTANGAPVEDALVCISQNGVYYSAYTDANGEVTIEQDFTAGNVLLVVTAFNTTTIYEEISCTAGNVPFLVLTDHTPTIVDYGTTPFLSLSFENRGGVATTEYATVTIACNDPLMTVTDATGYVAPMAANGGTATAQNEFRLSVDANVETGHVFPFTYTVTCDDETWSGSFSLLALGSDCAAPTGLAVEASGSDAIITWDDNSSIQNITIFEDVEDHEYGAINSPGAIGWGYVDGDGANTGTFQGLSFTNSGHPMAYIVLDDSQISGSNVVTAHSGHKYFGDAYCASSGGWGGQTAVQNDDWIISPELNFTSPFTFSFYARSYSSNYSTERFYAAYSTTGTNASDFTNLNSQATTTTTNWTEYTYTVPANAKYVAIHCISNDQYIFCLDDISITGESVTGNTYNLYRNGELIAANITGGTYTDENLPDGTYCYTLTMNCIDDFESAPSNMECVTIGTPVEQPCDAPTGVTISPANNQLGLSWEPVPSAISYKVYRNNFLLATTSNNFYTDQSVQNDMVYVYAVRSICAGGTSELSEMVSGQTALSQYDLSALRVYPNPASDVLHVEGEGIASISLFTAVGALVQETEVEKSETTLSTEALPNGIYFVRIRMRDGAEVSKKVLINNH